MARFDLSDFEWSVIEPLLPTKVRGVAPERLIPPMIERFIATDRSYAKTRRSVQPG